MLKDDIQTLQGLQHKIEEAAAAALDSIGTMLMEAKLIFDQHAKKATFVAAFGGDFTTWAMHVTGYQKSTISKIVGASSVSLAFSETPEVAKASRDARYTLSTVAPKEQEAVVEAAILIAEEAGRDKGDGVAIVTSDDIRAASKTLGAAKAKNTGRPSGSGTPEAEWDNEVVVLVSELNAQFPTLTESAILTIGAAFSENAANKGFRKAVASALEAATEEDEDEIAVEDGVQVFEN